MSIHFFGLEELNFGELRAMLGMGLMLAGTLVSRPVSVTAEPLEPPPLPVLSPAALTGDAGDGRVYLRWNPQIEDERVVGWHVEQREPVQRRVTDEPLRRSDYVVRDLDNGQVCTFVVVGVLADGGATPPSNAVTVAPRDVGEAEIEQLEADTTLDIGTHRVQVHELVPRWRPAVRIMFPDGQELVYDNFRPIDWKTRDGEHLLYPKQFGNGIDIGKMDARGLPHEVIAPDDRQTPQLQQHRDRPYITEPYTRFVDDATRGSDRPYWRSAEVDGDRVTLHYWLPMGDQGYVGRTYVQVWETWWPIERERHGTTYHGLARLVEVEMPSFLKHGYQVMLNNGFGPNGGSREGVRSYSSGFRRPGAEIVDFSGDQNERVRFHHPNRPPRQAGYHPNQNAFQSVPIIFYDWGHGSLTITARSLYHHAPHASGSYIEQGHDGVWPNLAFDLGHAGERVAVDTIEYLYAADTETQALPQRFINARMQAYRDVSHRMGLQDRVTWISRYHVINRIERAGGIDSFARNVIDEFQDTSIDAFGVFHDMWFSHPVVVDDAHRLDPEHGVNPGLRSLSEQLREAGIRLGFWIRPELVKTTLITAMSSHLPALEGFYHTHGVPGENHLPNPDDHLQTHGLQPVRENPHWLRLQRDGAWPVDTPYNWVPMSLATGWWDQIMWPTLHTARELGYDWVLIDGGSGGLPGVEYGPLLSGDSPHALPAQPYWWRMFRTIHHLGIDIIGEVNLGWTSAAVNLTAEGDEHLTWVFQSSLVDSRDRFRDRPEVVHRFLQLYNGTRGPDTGAEHVRRFAADFHQRHPEPPLWVELKNLRRGDPVELNMAPQESPIAGVPFEEPEDGEYTLTIDPWVWDEVVWHFEDGTNATYPAYDQVDWGQWGDG